MARMRFTAAIGISLALLGCANPPPVDAPAKNQPEDRVARPATGKGGGSATVSADVTSQSRPDFSGHWILDAKASDDPMEKAKEAMQATKQARGGGRGMGGGSGGMGRGGGMGGGHQGRGASAGMGGGGQTSGEMAALLASSAELHISQQDPMLLITDENDQRQRLYTDFRGASVSANGGLHQRVAVAGWEAAVLVVETTMLGKKLTQGYQIDGTGRLVITSVAQVSGTQTVTYRLVYERMKPGVGRG